MNFHDISHQPIWRGYQGHHNMVCILCTEVEHVEIKAREMNTDGEKDTFYLDKVEPNVTFTSLGKGRDSRMILPSFYNAGYLDE